VARLCTVIANTSFHKDPKKRPYKEDEFMPKRKKVSKAKAVDRNPNDMLTMLRIMNAAAGGKEVTHGS
jgi:hypothetical protein